MINLPKSSKFGKITELAKSPNFSEITESQKLPKFRKIIELPKPLKFSKTTILKSPKFGKITESQKLPTLEKSLKFSQLTKLQKSPKFGKIIDLPEAKNKLQDFKKNSSKFLKQSCFRFAQTFVVEFIHSRNELIYCIFFFNSLNTWCKKNPLRVC